MKIDAINCEEIKVDISIITSKKFFEQVKDIIKAIKNKHYIHFIKVNMKEIPAFKEKSFINNSIIQLEKSNKYTYTLQGLFFSEQNKEINLLVYEHLSQRWYSLKEQKWILD